MGLFKIVSFNAEGISPAKTQILSDLQADILCLQETLKDLTLPDIPDMHLIVHQGSPVHGSAIYAHEKAIITNSENLSENGLEILRVETRAFHNLAFSEFLCSLGVLLFLFMMGNHCNFFRFLELILDHPHGGQRSQRLVCTPG